MARPRLGKSESVRLQMVITADEIAEIDAWRFTFGSASRAEAIRHLVRLGMGASMPIRKFGPANITWNPPLEFHSGSFPVRSPS